MRWSGQSSVAQNCGFPIWALRGSFLGHEPELTVVEGQSTRLEAGLPLKVEPQLVVDEERTLSIRLRISGAGGESYRWSPRRIDIVTSAADDEKSEEIHGVYELRGDEVYVCLSSGDEPRPTSLRASPGTAQVSFVLKRQRP